MKFLSRSKKKVLKRGNTDCTELQDEVAAEKLRVLEQKKAEELCIKELKEFCQLFGIRLSDIQIFRYALCHDFKYEAASKAIEKTYDSPFMHLKMTHTLARQFRKAVMMPLPGLRTKTNSQVLYMRGSRHITAGDKSKHLINNLYYLLNDLSRTREDVRNGVAIIANFKDYGMKNYDWEVTKEGVKAFEGRLVPTHVTDLIFVDAPKPYIAGWKLLRPVLAPWMAEKVHFIKADKLGTYLVEGYEQLLPDDLEGGWKNTQELVDDYIDLKKYDEKK